VDVLGLLDRMGVSPFTPAGKVQATELSMVAQSDVWAPSLSMIDSSS